LDGLPCYNWGEKWQALTHLFRFWKIADSLRGAAIFFIAPKEADFKLLLIYNDCAFLRFALFVFRFRGWFRAFLVFNFKMKKERELEGFGRWFCFCFRKCRK